MWDDEDMKIDDLNAVTTDITGTHQPTSIYLELVISLMNMRVNM